MNRPEIVLFYTKDLSPDIIIAGFGICIPWIFFPEISSYACHLIFQCQALDSSRGPLTSVVERLGCITPEVLKQKVYGKPVDLLLNRVGLLSVLADHSRYDRMLITVCVAESLLTCYPMDTYH